MGKIEKGKQLTNIMPESTESFRVTEVSEVDKNGKYFFRAKGEVSGYETADFVEDENNVTLEESEYRRQRSGMPDAYMAKTGKDFDWSVYGDDAGVQTTKDLLNRFIMEFRHQEIAGRGLYIYSWTKGSGKTLLACCIANEVIKRYDINVKFISMSDYLQKVADKSETAREEVKAIREATLLIVDDIGATTTYKDWDREKILALVDFRYKRKLLTIYTSNVESLELKCGDRAVERIYADTLDIKLPEVNVRRMKADKYKQEEIKNMLEKAQELGEDTAF
ncbi:ATP-binding protein [Blautia stercoris]